MKSIKKYIAFLLVLSLIIASLAGCASNSANNSSNSASANRNESANADENTANSEENTNSSENTDFKPSGDQTFVRIGSLTGPTTLGLLKLYKDADDSKTENTYEYTIAGTADELTPLMIKGELDVLAGPANLAAVLNAKTDGKIQMLAITTLGVLSILSEDNSIKTWDDLKGRTIYATGKGSTPEYVLTYLLAQNGIDPGKDLTIEFKSEPAEIVSLLKTENDKNAAIMLPQPFATAAQTQIDGLSVIFDLTAEWDKIGDSSKLLTACLMVRREFAEQNPHAVDILLREYTASAEWVNSNASEAAELAEAYIGIKAGVAQKAIPLCNIVSINGSEMQSAAANYLKALFDQNPASVGGALPVDSFYYIAK